MEPQPTASAGEYQQIVSVRMDRWNSTRLYRTVDSVAWIGLRIVVLRLGL